MAFEPLADGHDGYYRPSQRRIAINTAVAINQQAAALAHELAHALVRLDHQPDDPQLGYASEELVAESVVFCPGCCESPMATGPGVRDSCHRRCGDGGDGRSESGPRGPGSVGRRRSYLAPRPMPLSGLHSHLAPERVAVAAVSARHARSRRSPHRKESEMGFRRYVAMPAVLAMVLVMVVVPYRRRPRSLTRGTSRSRTASRMTCAGSRFATTSMPAGTSATGRARATSTRRSSASPPSRPAGPSPTSRPARRSRSSSTSSTWM